MDTIIFSPGYLPTYLPSYQRTYLPTYLLVYLPSLSEIDNDFHANKQAIDYTHPSLIMRIHRG